MATASIAKQLNFDYLCNSDTYRALQGFEALESAFLDQETQMEFGESPNSSIVVEVSNQACKTFVVPSSQGASSPFFRTQKTKLVGTIRNIYNPYPTETLGYVGSTNSTIRGHQTQQLQSPQNDFGQYMEYVDSPPDSKEAWPVEYLKSKCGIISQNISLNATL